MLNASANSTTTKDNCLKNAIAVQSEIFGKENIAKMRNSAPNEQKDLQRLSKCDVLWGFLH
ncbi:MAG: hypothetical protein MR902_04445 [Campylobacter sp.]|nr:hypothetical protein [Campylobacter sp.]